MQKPTPTPQTAAEAYARHANRISSILDLLSAEVEAHATKQQASPRNWGFAGDLEELESKLKAALAWMSGMQPQQIDEALDELETPGDGK